MGLKQNGFDTPFEIECDECEYSEDTGVFEFREAVQWAKDNGWKLRKDKLTGWVNICPTCATKK